MLYVLTIEGLTSLTLRRTCDNFLLVKTGCMVTSILDRSDFISSRTRLGSVDP